MKLLLIVLDNYRLAINTEFVSRIIDTGKKNPPKKKFLFNPGKTKKGVLLKNNYILPAREVEEIISFTGDVIRPSPFLEECMKNMVLEGFIIINEKIYSLLNKMFLKIDDTQGE